MEALTLDSVIKIVEAAVATTLKQRNRKTGSNWDNEFARIRRNFASLIYAKLKTAYQAA